VGAGRLTFAHYRFKQYLKDRGQQAMCEVIEVSEAYTSKTCPYCGTQHKIGSKKRNDGVEAGLQLWCRCRSRFKRRTGDFSSCFGGYALIDPPKINLHLLKRKITYVQPCSAEM
jgi:hypothetical protein